MPIKVDLRLTELVGQLPEPMRQARQAFTRSVMTGTLEPRLVEYVRLRSAGINGCKLCLTKGVPEEQQTAQVADPETVDELTEREKVAIVFCDRLNLDPEGFDGAFTARLKTLFTVSEILELAYSIKWFAMLQALNDVFDVEPDTQDLHAFEEMLYADPSVDRSHPFFERYDEVRKLRIAEFDAQKVAATP